jgi:hypothetical protein
VENDRTARVEMTSTVSFDLIDDFICGWKEAVLLEIDRMRSQMPYADRIEIRLTTERRTS